VAYLFVCAVEFVPADQPLHLAIQSKEAFIAHIISNFPFQFIKLIELWGVRDLLPHDVVLEGQFLEFKGAFVDLV